MRGRDRPGGELDPAVAGALAAMEAALAGAPADPDYTELSGLARLVADTRPGPAPGELADLDRAVSQRTIGERAARRRRIRPVGADNPAPTARLPRRGMGRWMPRPLLGGAAAALAVGAVAAVLVASPGGESGGSGVSGATSSATVMSSSSSAASAPRPGFSAPGSAAGAASAAGPEHGAPSASGSAAGPPHPAAEPGRQVVQGAQLELAAAPARIDQVAQEVFDVVGAENGIVNRSTVDSGGAANAYAIFSLSLPSANLPQALQLLSTLRGAQVLSRTDSTSDITGTVNAAGQRLTEARALRASLLRQLAAATTDAGIARLQGQLHAVDGQISADATHVARLHHQVADSQVTVTVQPASSAPGPAPRRRGASFTLGRALHDAGRVLVVAAGAALIGLAVALPLGLLGALLLWLWLAIRRWRREAALDQP
jgi:hypothetical protein